MGRPCLAYLAACSVVCLTACGHATAARIHEVPPGRSIVVFGDSLALGTGASDASRGFAFVLYGRILARTPSALITSYAIGGARVADLIDEELPQAAGHVATDVWVCVGANDVTHGTPPKRFRQDLQKLLRSIRRHWPQARLVIFGIPDVSRSPLFAGSGRADLSREAGVDNTAMHAVAAEYGGTFIDLFTFSRAAMDARRDLASDNFHPNDRGHRAIAEYAAGALRLP
ncbi:MAG: SGNH/GDSL hydrolase family protein [Candidatus Eremiobacteraeota bacterium]|nr:SGNH/GDSL hydrolase family protein [Candidatus Eremiobacteraeota bacterium]MBC5827538.1 SGNH/GDSL hydrolase family protein [Candidatus Eremiobacteraeota bacterium]